ncbi:hypothetical protein OROHE_000526 [Orobanche hederae]
MREQLTRENHDPGTVLFFARAANRKKRPWKGKGLLE